MHQVLKKVGFFHDPKRHACKVCVVRTCLWVLGALSTLGNIGSVHNPQHLLLLLIFLPSIVVITTTSTQ